MSSTVYRTWANPLRRWELTWLLMQGLGGQIQRRRMTRTSRRKGHVQNDLPQTLIIGLANRCNLKCLYCPREALEYPDGPEITLDLFEKHIEPYIRGGQEITLTGLGEPLLAKDLFAIIKRCRRKGARVNFTSNATLWTEENCRKIVEARPEFIHISIDGVGEGLKRVRGIGIEVLEKNIETFLRIRSKMRSRRPQLCINFVASLVNVDELPELVRWSGKIGIHYIKTIAMIAFDPSMQKDSLFHDVERAEQRFREAAREASRADVFLGLPDLRGRVVECSFPFWQLIVMCDGTVTTCCMPYLKPFGNIFETPLPQIWNNPRFVDLRARLSGERPLLKECQNCSLRVFNKKAFTDAASESTKDYPTRHPSLL